MAKIQPEPDFIGFDSETAVLIGEKQEEIARLILLADMFAERMKRKLIYKCLEGYKDWGGMETKDIKQKIREHLKKGDMVDVANFAAFDWGNKNEEFKERANQ